MTSYDTHGYDAVVEIGEAAVDEMLSCRFATGAIPVARSQEFDLGPATVTVEFLFDTPWARFVTDAGEEGDRPGVKLALPFDDSYSSVTVADREWEAVDLAGSIQLVAPFRTRTDGDWIDVALDLSSAAAAVTFTDDTVREIDDLGGRLQDEFGPLVPDDVDLENLSETARERFQGLVESGEVGLPDAAGLDVSVPAEDVDLKVVDAPSGVDRVLFLLVTLRTEAGEGDAAAFDERVHPGGNTAGFYLDSDFVLAEFVRPQLAESFNLSPGDFDRPCRLADPEETELTLDGDTRTVTVRELAATATEGAIEIDGEMFTEEDHADVTITFGATIEVTFEDGGPSFEMVDTTSDTDIEVPWWYQIPASVGWSREALYLEITSRELDVSSKVTSALRSRGEDLNESAANAAGALDAVLGRIDVRTFSFDEEAMAFVGVLDVGEDCRPAASASDTEIFLSEGIDLDTGNRTWVAPPAGPTEVDVRFARSGGEFSMRPGPEASIHDLGELSAILPPPRYRMLSVLDLEGLEYPGAGEKAIAGQALPNWPWDYPRRRLFAVYTSEGRYAKCLAHRATAKLHLHFVTFDRPTPSVAVSHRQRETIEKKKVEEGRERWGEVHCTANPGGTGPGGPGEAGVRESDVGESGSFGGSGGFGESGRGGVGDGGAGGFRGAGGHRAGGLAGVGARGVGERSLARSGGTQTATPSTTASVRVESHAAEYGIYEKSFRITFRALTERLAFPLASVDWRIAGEKRSGSGTVDVDGHELDYRIDGPECVLETELGEALSVYLGVEVEDARGLVFEDDYLLELDETHKEGGRPQGAERRAREEIEECVAAAAAAGEDGPGPGGPRPDPRRDGVGGGHGPGGGPGGRPGDPGPGRRAGGRRGGEPTRRDLLRMQGGESARFQREVGHRDGREGFREAVLRGMDVDSEGLDALER